MAISKDQAGVLTEKELAVINEAEKWLDAWLDRNWKPGQKQELQLHPGSLNKIARDAGIPLAGKIRDELLRRFKNQGWEVRINQNYLLFS